MAAWRPGTHHPVIVGLVLLVGLSLGFPGRALAQQPTPTATAAPAWLLVQGFDAATLHPAPATGPLTLTLAGIDPRVLAFADRPVRRVGFVATAAFVQAVTQAALTDPLNATLAAPLPDGRDALLVVELRAAVLDATAQTVAFQVTILGAATGAPAGAPATPLATSGGRTFGPGTLFVDEVAAVPVTVPVNACGNTASVVGALNPVFGNTCVHH